MSTDHSATGGGGRRLAALVPPGGSEPPQRIRLWGEYYILSSSLATRHRKRVLNHGDTFGVFDATGDVDTAAGEDLGLFSHGARHLSRWELRVGGQYPRFLHSGVTDDSCTLVVALANPDVEDLGSEAIPRDTLYIERSQAVVGDALYERIRFRSYHPEPVRIPVELRFAADFCDVFEVRGYRRRRFGRRLPSRVGGREAVLCYEGSDGVRRETRVRLFPSLLTLTDDRAVFEVRVAPQEEVAIEAAVLCVRGDGHRPVMRSYGGATRQLRRERRRWRAGTTSLTSSNETFNRLLRRAIVDVSMLLCANRDGPFPYAGIPWFAAIFGRDALITAWELLPVAPDVAAATLRTLARLQGAETSAEREEEPGKIIHELRDGEIAATGEIPFHRYYGSIDATPLFLVLLGAYVRRTGDLELARELWPHAEAAMQWIDSYGDSDGDGYVEYRRAGSRGLLNQGWKDSDDAVFHADGSLARPPIALAEVQAYVYAARKRMAETANVLGRHEQAARWEAPAQSLRDAFHRDFWSERLGGIVLALDGDKRPCEVLTSNAGQCLATGILEPGHAAHLCERLLQADMFSGWGIRTLSSEAPRFNPMSYHNGSVWPHDNALIALGLRRGGRLDAALRVLGGMFEASLFFDGARFPELFCGFARRLREGPVPYALACRPQAWAAASIFMFLQAILGLEFDGLRQRVMFERPRLPDWLDWLEMKGLRVGSGSVDLTVHRGRRGGSIEVTRKEGDLEVVVLPH